MCRILLKFMYMYVQYMYMYVHVHVLFTCKNRALGTSCLRRLSKGTFLFELHHLMSACCCTPCYLKKEISTYVHVYVHVFTMYNLYKEHKFMVFVKKLFFYLREWVTHQLRGKFHHNHYQRPRCL